MSGTLSNNEPWSRPVSGIDLPETAQVRKDIMKATPNTAIAQAGVGLRLRAHTNESGSHREADHPHCQRERARRDGQVRQGDAVAGHGQHERRGLASTPREAEEDNRDARPAPP